MSTAADKLATPMCVHSVMLCCLLQTARLELSRLDARRRELMGRVGALQSQLAALVEEEEGLLRQQLEGKGCFTVTVTQ
jgi:hypothetical protein